MKRGRLPLTALRSFEAAGRLASFTEAAAELFVSQAAISRQIRDLEALIGKPLFERHHRSVSLTADGEALLTVLTDSFDRIGESLDALSDAKRAGTLRVSAEPSFAGCWLVPHLAQFQAEHPEIEGQVRVERGAIFADGALVLQAALRGHGVALMDRDHVRDDLKVGVSSGPLTYPFPMVRSGWLHGGSMRSPNPPDVS